MPAWPVATKRASRSARSAAAWSSRQALILPTDMSEPTASSRRGARAAARADPTTRFSGSRRRSQIQRPGRSRDASWGSSPSRLWRPLATESPASRPTARSAWSSALRRPPEGANPTTATAPGAAPGLGSARAASGSSGRASRIEPTTGTGRWMPVSRTRSSPAWSGSITATTGPRR